MPISDTPHIKELVLALKPNESRFSTLVVAKSAMEMDTNAPRGGALRNIAKRASGTWGRISEEYNMVRHSIEEEIARLTKLMNQEIETTTPPAPLSLFNNKPLPSSSALPDLPPLTTDSKSLNRTA